MASTSAAGSAEPADPRTPSSQRLLETLGGGGIKKFDLVFIPAEASGRPAWSHAAQTSEQSAQQDAAERRRASPQSESAPFPADDLHGTRTHDVIRK